MSGQLSPDGNFYWDGVRWASAVTPDGAWRWDGRGWRSSVRRQSGRSSRTAVLIAAAAIALLLVSGLGLLAVTRLAVNAQRSFRAGFSPTCTGIYDTPGFQLGTGETLCGKTLGAILLDADCATTGALPDGAAFWQQGATDARPVAVTVTADELGCDLNEQKGGMIWAESDQSFPAASVAVADFQPDTEAGAVGLQLGCTDTDCIDIWINLSGSTYFLRQESGGTWTTLKRGPLPILALASRVDSANRIVLRYVGGSLQGYLNGYEVVQASVPSAPSDGTVLFYVDDRNGLGAEEIHMQALYAFASS